MVILYPVKETTEPERSSRIDNSGQAPRLVCKHSETGLGPNLVSFKNLKGASLAVSFYSVLCISSIDYEGTNTAGIRSFHTKI